MFDDAINNALGKFWASSIQKVDIDLFQFQISMEFVVYLSEDDSEKHKITFDGVSSFFFANGTGENRFNTEPWEQAELSEIYFYRKPKDHIAHVHDKLGTARYDVNPNFNLEIWSSAFLIEAKAILIDGVRYESV